MFDFLETFKMRRDCCRDIFKFSCQQDELIESDDYTQLLVVLGKKQQILGRMQELSQPQSQLWQQWKNCRDALDPQSQAKCETILAETESILAQVIERENASTKKMSMRRDATRLQIESIAQGARANEAYRDNLAPATHRRLDVDQ